MASILDFLNTPKGEDFISKVSEITSEDKDKITAALGLSFPMLLTAMKNNISSAEGNNSLYKALQEKDNSEKLLENIKDLDASKLIAKGGGILDHILGSNQNALTAVIASTLQMKESSASDILKMASPLLLSILSTQNKREKLDATDLEALVDSLLGSSSKFDPSLVQTFLEKNKDGNIIDNVEGMIFGGSKNDKKDGGILGGMLGGK